MENTYTKNLKRQVNALTSIRESLSDVLATKLTADLVYDSGSVYQTHRNNIIKEVNQLGSTINAFNTYITRCETYNKKGW